MVHKLCKTRLMKYKQTLGLSGMGGLGKTTISKANCNDLSPKFCDNVCHIELRNGNEVELLWKALKRGTNIQHDILDM